MKKEKGLQKGPVIRAIELELFAPGIPAPVLRGTVSALDHLRGSTSHAVSGVLRNQQGDELDFSGQLDGVVFAGKEKPLGRPSKDMRNVAVYMAFEWFQAIRKNSKNAEARARSDTLDYWQSQGWEGASNQNDFNKLILRGTETALQIMGVPSDTPKKQRKAGDTLAYRSRCDTDGVCVILPKGRMQHQPGNLVTGSGEGLFWRYGEEKSRFYDFIVQVDLKNC